MWLPSWTFYSPPLFNLQMTKFSKEETKSHYSFIRVLIKVGKLRDFDAGNGEDIGYLKWKYWFRVGGIYYTEAACHIMLHSQSWEFIENHYFFKILFGLCKNRLSTLNSFLLKIMYKHDILFMDSLQAFSPFFLLYRHLFWPFWMK